MTRVGDLIARNVRASIISRAKRNNATIHDLDAYEKLVEKESKEAKRLEDAVGLNDARVEQWYKEQMVPVFCQIARLRRGDDVICSTAALFSTFPQLKWNSIRKSIRDNQFEKLECPYLHSKGHSHLKNGLDVIWDADVIWTEYTHVTMPRGTRQCGLVRFSILRDSIEQVDSPEDFADMWEGVCFDEYGSYRCSANYTFYNQSEVFKDG